MRRQNKKSLKNLKQYCKNRVRFTFYVRFRPVAQKLFFPIISLILLAGIVHYEMTRDKSWVFINPVAAEFDENAIVQEAQPSKSEVRVNGFAAQKAPQTQMLEGSTSTDPSPVRASSVVEEKIYEVFSEEGRLAVAVAKAESSLNPEAKGWNCYYWYNSKRYSGACKESERNKAWSVDCGLFQINVTGQECPTELYDIEHNTKVAKNMSESERGWAHWWTYNTGKYKKYL